MSPLVTEFSLSLPEFSRFLKILVGCDTPPHPPHPPPPVATPLPTLKDDERFRNGLVCDLEMKLKTLLCSTCSKTISRTIFYTNSPLNVSMNYVRKCDSIANLIEDKRSTKNVLVIYAKYIVWPPSSNSIVI